MENKGKLILIHSFYLSPYTVRVIKSRKLRWTCHVAKMDDGRSVFRILTGKPAGKRLLRRHRHRWEDHIRMDLKK